MFLIFHCIFYNSSSEHQEVQVDGDESETQEIEPHNEKNSESQYGRCHPEAPDERLHPDLPGHFILIFFLGQRDEAEGYQQSHHAHLGKQVGCAFIEDRIADSYPGDTDGGKLYAEKKTQADCSKW